LRTPPGFAPIDSLFAGHDQRFPNHPTSNQFLSGELFDAYRALGWSVGEQLVRVLRLPQERFDEPRQKWSGGRAEATDTSAHQVHRPIANAAPNA